ncbi:hypothetical protein [Streptomyces sp. ML-6]|uniref:hypothetical protein n=1 Tax=Streptomyces sp. ML-6 TaxID=2982693 RepID=UPI0024C0BD19|nr:hypothetical protein [Streptomyces sp. ML-6]MDK0524832.1 hypothetical protein [Streptomyces sp. ML-6]
MSSTNRNIDHALAYPEPPTSPLWHHGKAKARPLTVAEQRRNRELLTHATRFPCSPRPASGPVRPPAPRPTPHPTLQEQTR